MCLFVGGCMSCPDGSSKMSTMFEWVFRGGIHQTLLCYNPKTARRNPLLIKAFLNVHTLSIYNSLRCPVTLSIRLLDAGPIPKTVWLPLAICVLPASAIISATRPKLTAVACKVSKSSSLLTCSAIFAWPVLSHRLRIGVFFFR
jgi:hypothetical protein